VFLSNVHNGIDTAVLSLVWGLVLSLVWSDPESGDEESKAEPP